MWLIHTTTLTLEEKLNPEADGIRYAILSHQWGDDEVSMQDFADLATARTKAGFDKIDRTCRRARQDGLCYAWVDTCCIDKSSSAELTEAINSMYAWYRASTACYAYIADFSARTDTGQPLDNDALGVTLGCSRWFTRGWTLQELIAPANVEFFDCEWNNFGSKQGLFRILGTITGIQEDILTNRTDPSSVLVCDRMSWAANRETTRTEDMAYCLLGIFDVNLPLIYGEGHKAFQRLQEEIARKSNDMSLFAWSSSYPVYPKYQPPAYKKAASQPAYRGAFAWAPSEFRKSDTFIAFRSSHTSSPPTFDLDRGLGIVIRDVSVHAAREGQDVLYWLRLQFSGRAVYRLIHAHPHGVVFYNKSPVLKKYDSRAVSRANSNGFLAVRLLGQEDALELSSDTNESVELGLYVRERWAGLTTEHGFSFYSALPRLLGPDHRWCDIRESFIYPLKEVHGLAPDEFHLFGAMVHSVLVMAETKGGVYLDYWVDILSCVGLQPEKSLYDRRPSANTWEARLGALCFVKGNGGIMSNHMHEVLDKHILSTHRSTLLYILQDKTNDAMKKEGLLVGTGEREVSAGSGMVHRLVVACEAVPMDERGRRWAFQLRCYRQPKPGVLVLHDWERALRFTDAVPANTET